MQIYPYNKDKNGILRGLDPYIVRVERIRVLVHRRRVDADIASEAAGAWPAHPDASRVGKRLGLDLTTVTRAYGEARRRGLARSLGGTRDLGFRNDRADDGGCSCSGDDRSFDEPAAATRGSQSRRAHRLEAVQNQASFSAFLNHQRAGGNDEEREVAAKWLRAHTGCECRALGGLPGQSGSPVHALRSLTSPPATRC